MHLFGGRTKLTFSYSLISEPSEETHFTHSSLSSTGIFLTIGS